MRWFKKLFSWKGCKYCIQIQKSSSDLITQVNKKAFELEKELAFWKEKALNYRKPHSHQ